MFRRVEQPDDSFLSSCQRVISTDQPTPSNGQSYWLPKKSFHVHITVPFSPFLSVYSSCSPHSRSVSTKDSEEGNQEWEGSRTISGCPPLPPKRTPSSESWVPVSCSSLAAHELVYPLQPTSPLSPALGAGLMSLRVLTSPLKWVGPARARDLI